MKIRKAKEADREAILGIMKQWNMHHIPSEEMPELNIDCFFVAEIDGKIVGASGYKMLTKTQGKTTLLGVDKDHGRQGIGMALQEARIKKMYDLGAEWVTTNTDRTTTLKWYIKHFGYYKMGWIKKVHSFGNDNVDEWTTIEMDLEEYYNEKRISSSVKTVPSVID